MKTFDPLAVELEGVQLLQASAGTGKTYSLTALFLRLLLERRLKVGQVLVVTFTQAATAELRDQVRQRLRQVIAALDSGQLTGEEVFDRYLERRQKSAAEDRVRLVQAVREFDEAAIYTIHGFCHRGVAGFCIRERGVVCRSAADRFAADHHRVGGRLLGAASAWRRSSVGAFLGRSGN